MKTGTAASLPKEKIILLPRYFRTIGIALVVFSLLAIIGFAFSGIEFTGMSKDTLKLFSKNLIIAGLFMIAWAKGKIENEQSFFFRLKVLGIALFAGVIHVIIKPFVDQLFGGPIENITAQDFLFLVLPLHIFFYYSQKKYVARKKDNNAGVI